ncbi:xanthine dehydrogenase family protein molybdopterin-binding subunit [Mycobacterium sp. CVI_P3]|uniref:Xanthine dehydrogenase family protein molybdopterin-binding subunit n=1 Tax=Mycobacterium pinniadriaticum TaxID=2994102 RepID=A0ABT3SJ69_9MYCO|nr:xanthine dehydrogenase family protein molybdopterin-binding subunit [Mycobacterium pinniadriaticum]MCX2933127.1 xanthine dehydrogenase family protein molybdopterin-binding subunit [Mycobacterium pinniadriaticum]MCX2939573.1 xanthine dehydrogenase family protein molybdopterin-binding subunit [Mycobacterium pinniadriaticum]
MALGPAAPRVGAPVNRVDGEAKVTGAARYTADTEVPGSVYAVLVGAGIARAEIIAESMAESSARARAAPGVLHVLTPMNCPPLKPPPTDFTKTWPVERRPPLSDMSVHHVGQHVAVVIADSFENATYAASEFALEYQQAPADGDTAVRSDSYRPDHWVEIVDEKLQDQRGGGIPEPLVPVQVSGRYRTAATAPYPMELCATIAQWDGDRLTVHDSTRWISGERRLLAHCLGLPESSVRVISPLVGGAFGSKVFLWAHVLLCALAAREVQRPVKLVLTRKQMFDSTGYRPRTEQEVTLLADAEGLICSTTHHTVTETSVVGDFCEPAGLSSRLLYHSPRLAVSHRVDRKNVATPSFMRAPGESSGLFALEVAMDELAGELGIDPLELRIRNHIDIDQTNGRPWSDKHLLDCYLSAADRFGWAHRPPDARSLRRNHVQVGWGMATATFPARRASAGCRVSTGADGCVRFASATHEIGTGVRTVMTQLAADILGLPLSAVVFDSGDSSYPETPRSGASQTTATVGAAVIEAATQWRRRLTEVAPSATLTAESLAALSPGQLAALTFSVTTSPAIDERASIRSFGAHFCEVEVDEQIGRAAVTRWTAAFACGPVLNPKLARSQLMGGITFGVGMALLEQMQRGGEYYLPTHADRPDFDIDLIEKPVDDVPGPTLRGIGEIGIAGVPAAVANAIYHATGKRLRTLPITVEDLMLPVGPRR